MFYLGGICGDGVLKHEGKDIARVSYDFDGFYKKTTGIMGCGEIRTSAVALKSVFRAKGLELMTDDGRQLYLTFSEMKLPEASNVAHVDVSGELPKDRLDWSRTINHEMA